MNFKEPVFAVSQITIGTTLLVAFSDGSRKTYDAVKLGCEWFRMDNDTFYDLYGFNFNPHKHGLYEHCRKLVYPNEP